MSNTLEYELAEMIIDFCNVEDVAPEDISADAPLIGPDSPFGLDSLDAVEVVVAVQKTYGVRIGGEKTSREVLQSLRTLAAFISRERGDA
jgi:acyl carrier protein